MGFGSYDESEQENQELQTDDEETEAINIHESDHEGEVTFESELSTSDLVNRLDEMNAGESDE